MKWLVSKGQDGVSALGLVVARLTAHGSKPSIGLAWSNTSLSTVQCNQCIPMQQDKKLQNKVQQREQQNTTEYDIICIKHIGLENIYDWKTHEDTLFSHFTFWGRHSAGALQTMETAFCRGKQVAQEPWRQMTADDGRSQDFMLTDRHGNKQLTGYGIDTLWTSMNHEIYWNMWWNIEMKYVMIWEIMTWWEMQLFAEKKSPARSWISWDPEIFVWLQALSWRRPLHAVVIQVSAVCFIMRSIWFNLSIFVRITCDSLSGWSQSDHNWSISWSMFWCSRPVSVACDQQHVIRFHTDQLINSILPHKASENALPAAADCRQLRLAPEFVPHMAIGSVVQLTFNLFHVRTVLTFSFQPCVWFEVHVGRVVQMHFCFGLRLHGPIAFFFLQKDLRSAERLVSNISNAEGTWGPWQPNFDESVTGTAVEQMERWGLWHWRHLENTQGALFFKTSETTTQV